MNPLYKCVGEGGKCVHVCVSVCMLVCAKESASAAGMGLCPWGLIYPAAMEGYWEPEAVTGQTGRLTPADGGIHIVHMYFSLYVEGVGGREGPRDISGDHQ